MSPKEGLRLARIYYELDDNKNQRSAIVGLPQRKWNVNRYSSVAYERPPLVDVIPFMMRYNTNYMWAG